MRRGELRSGPRLMLWAPLVGLLTVLGLILPPYWISVFSMIAIGALIARSIGLVVNQAGIITLCQIAFAAIGGWVVARVALLWPDAPFPLLVFLGALPTAAIGVLLGFATARIRGVELAVVTLGFAAVVDLVQRQLGFPGVGAGIPVVPAAPFDDSRWFFALAWGLLIAMQLLVAALARSRHGLAWAAVRTSERTAAALGVWGGAAKASAFAVGALLAGAAGGMLAGQYGLLTTAVFSPLTSMVHVATAVLCGASLFSGAVLAGVFATLVPEVLRRLGIPLDVGNALLAVGAFDVLRRGNGGLVEQWAARIQERAFRDVRVECELEPLLPAVAPEAHPVGGAPCGAPRSPEPLFSVAGLGVVFGGDRVLSDVDLTIHRGEVHALIGANGAGKSTLVDAVTGFLPDYEGTVRLNGRSLDALRAQDRAHAGVRRTFQDARALETLTVGDYLRLGAGAGTAGAKAARQSAAGDLLGLPDSRVPVRLMGTVSRRMLEIAGALAAGPSVVLLDEPAAGLTDLERRELADRVARIPEAFGTAVLLIEHDMEFVRRAARRATALGDGRVIASGRTAEVLESPAVIAAYLGAEATA